MHSRHRYNSSNSHSRQHLCLVPCCKSTYIQWLNIGLALCLSLSLSPSLSYPMLEYWNYCHGSCCHDSRLLFQLRWIVLWSQTSNSGQGLGRHWLRSPSYWYGHLHCVDDPRCLAHFHDGCCSDCRGGRLSAHHHLRSFLSHVYRRVDRGDGCVVHLGRPRGSKGG